MPTKRRPHNTGWSGRDVADRLDQLGWTDLNPARSGAGVEITLLGRQLLNLSERVVNGKLGDRAAGGPGVRGVATVAGGRRIA